jgi:hypothetical protein
MRYVLLDICVDVIESLKGVDGCPRSWISRSSDLARNNGGTVRRDGGLTNRELSYTRIYQVHGSFQKIT